MRRDDARGLMPPPAILTAAARRLGGSIRAATPLSGGHTPQRVVGLELDDGREVVLKAAPPAGDGRVDWSAELRREIEAYGRWPFLDPWRPAFLGALEAAGWRALLTERVRPTDPVPPWSDETLAAVGRGLAALHGASARWVDSATDTRPSPYYRRIEEAGRRPGRIPPAWEREGWWEWLERVFAPAAEAFDTLLDEAEPRLVHYGVRSDNLFLCDGRLVLVDWSLARWRPPTVESVSWAVAVEADGGPDAPSAHEAYLRHRPETPDWQVLGGLAYVVGWLTTRLVTSDAPALVQRLRLRLLRPAVSWLSDRLGVEAPAFGR